MTLSEDYLKKLYRDFSNKLEYLNITQSEAAEILGITRSHLNKVINERTDPSVALLQKIERFCYGE